MPELKRCKKCGGEAACTERFSLRPYGVMWVASVWCRECYLCVDRMVSKRELELSNNPKVIKEILMKKAIECWNEVNADD